MRWEIWASVTERGQVTIPSEVRKALGIKAREKVIFAIEDGVVVLKKPRFTIETAYGSIKPLRTPEDWDERIREAKDDRVDEYMRKAREGSN